MVRNDMARLYVEFRNMTLHKVKKSEIQTDDTHNSLTVLCSMQHRVARIYTDHIQHLHVAFTFLFITKHSSNCGIISGISIMLVHNIFQLIDRTTLKCCFSRLKGGGVNFYEHVGQTCLKYLQGFSFKIFSRGATGFHRWAKRLK